MKNGAKIKVALIGGAFNPITLGHIKLAQFVMDKCDIQQTWIVPCYSHLYNKELISAKHRLQMCEIATQIDDRIKVCNYEIKNKFNGSTYHFIKNLLSGKLAHENTFSYVIGMDNANTFDKWVRYEELKEMIGFIVVSREGVKRNENIDWYLKKPHIYLPTDKEEIPEISSTEIRTWFRRYYWLRDIGNKDNQHIVEKLKYYLGENVLNYIDKNKLYKK